MQTMMNLAGEAPLLAQRAVSFMQMTSLPIARFAGLVEVVTPLLQNFVPVKSIEQQDLQPLYRSRDRVVGARTALIKSMRGLLAEYGIVLRLVASVSSSRDGMTAPTRHKRVM